MSDGATTASTGDADFDSTYSLRCEFLAPLGPVVVWLLGELLASANIRTHSITWRLKSKDSSLRKLSRMDADEGGLQEMGDLLGVRVITYFPDELDLVAEVVEREFNCDLDRSIDKRELLDPDRFGYVSVHYLARLTDRRTSFVEYQRFEDQSFEIQIRSILQHAWAEIEHDLGYKRVEAIPKTVRRRFSRLASLLETADEEFLSIRRDLEVYTTSIAKRVQVEPASVTIDQDSVREYVLSDPLVRELDTQVADLLGTKNVVVGSSEYYGKIAFALTIVGFQTIEDVAATLSHFSSSVTAFARVWIDPPGDHPRTSFGIGLYYLILTRGGLSGDQALLSRALSVYNFEERQLERMVAKAINIGTTLAA